MNATEYTTLTKMAIICCFTILVIGAVATVWYLMWDHSSDIERKWESAVNSASTEKLYQLQEQSETADKSDGVTRDVIEAHPLVTTVANTLSEFDADSLLYVYVVEDHAGSPRGNHLYTYTGVAITGHGTGDTPPGWNTKTTYSSDTPVTHSVKDLLTYSKYRCHLHMQEVEYGGTKLIGVVVEVLT